jgi:hypothetical protein
VQRILIAFVAAMMTLLAAGTAIAQETTTPAIAQETTTPAIAQETTTAAEVEDGEGGGGAADNQYGEDKVVVKTIPDKSKLADTSGPPLILLAGATLLSTGLLLGSSVIRRSL